jgi:TolA-binding protein
VFDNPIIFLILISIISGISEWLGKRRKAKQLEEQLGSGEVVLDDDDTERQQRRREVREQQEDWEERLRRMLAGEDPDENAPAARAEPPPAPIRQPEPVANTPRTSANKTTVQRQAPTASRSSQPSLGKPNFAGAPAPKVSDEVRKKAAQLERVGRKTLRDRSSGRPSTVQKFRSRSAARNAIMAAVVLGPAKGVGEESDILKL